MCVCECACALLLGLLVFSQSHGVCVHVHVCACVLFYHLQALKKCQQPSSTMSTTNCDPRSPNLVLVFVCVCVCVCVWSFHRESRGGVCVCVSGLFTESHGGVCVWSFHRESRCVCVCVCVRARALISSPGLEEVCVCARVCVLLYHLQALKKCQQPSSNMSTTNCDPKFTNASQEPKFGLNLPRVFSRASLSSRNMTHDSRSKGRPSEVPGKDPRS